MTTSFYSLPLDHAERIARARQAVDGLSVGDALGGQFFVPANQHLLAHPGRPVPPPTWFYTDDTEMALGILEVLDRHGHVEQDELARVFGHRYDKEMYRGYGAMAHQILSALHRGEPWKAVAPAVFGGQGSMGNGSAMRVAPVGAYFADDLERTAAEAEKSAVVTHAHTEGIAGAVATAVATAMAWRLRDRAGDAAVREEFFEAVLTLTPEGSTRRGIAEARALGDKLPVQDAAQALGNGSRVTAPDTVPFCLWAAARHLHDFVEAFWTTIHAGGDIDTTGAIVGGIVVMSGGRAGIPALWLQSRELLAYLSP
jgi:ADP-ribosylglycohydrolase